MFQIIRHLEIACQWEKNFFSCEKKKKENYKEQVKTPVSSWIKKYLNAKIKGEREILREKNVY